MPLQPIKVLTEAAKSLEELTNELAKLQKILNYLLEGNLDFDNIRAHGIKAENIEANAITANEIAANTITADKMDVDELSAINANLGTVTVGTLIGVLIQAATIIGTYITTSETYPRAEMSVTQNLIRAMQDPNNYMAMVGQGFGSVPSLSWFYLGSIIGFLNRSSGGTTLGTFSGDPLNLQGSSNIVATAVSGNINLAPAGSIQVNGDSGVSGIVYVSATSGGSATIPIEFTKGIRTS